MLNIIMFFVDGFIMGSLAVGLILAVLAIIIGPDKAARQLHFPRSLAGWVALVGSISLFGMLINTIIKVLGVMVRS